MYLVITQASNISHFSRFILRFNFLSFLYLVLKNVNKKSPPAAFIRQTKISNTFADEKISVSEKKIWRVCLHCKNLKLLEASEKSPGKIRQMKHII